MQLIVDVGNTNIKFGIFNQKNLIKVWYCSKQKCTAQWLKHLFKKYIGQIEQVYFGSVVPSFNKIIKNLLVKVFKVTPQIITSKDFKQAFDLRKYNLNEIGTDILAFALCVQDHQPKALGICFGTATFAVAINHRQINGVVIAPSIATGVKNLSTVTAMIRINKQDIKLLNSDLGQNTLTAVVGGSYHMFHGFINSLRDYCLKHYHIKQTYLSGGKLKQLNIKTTPHLKIINHAVLCGYWLIVNKY